MLLGNIFEKQLELMNKYHTIEEKSGIFNYQDGNIPVDIQTVAGQARLKHIAWCATEEVGEVVNAPIEEQPEELADALHFLAELCILSGYDADDFESLEYMFGVARRTLTGTKEEKRNWAVANFVFCLGRCMNLLKNKPWKQTLKETNMGSYHKDLKATMLSYVIFVHAYGIDTAEELHGLYFQKFEINKQRQATGY